MAYAANRTLSLKIDSTPSAACNNLSAPGGRLFYAHKDTICSFPLAALDGRPSVEVTRTVLPSETGFTNLTQVAAVVAAGALFLVVTCRSSFGIFRAEDKVGPSPSMALADFLATGIPPDLSPPSPGSSRASLSPAAAAAAGAASSASPRPGLTSSSSASTGGSSGASIPVGLLVAKWTLEEAGVPADRSDVEFFRGAASCPAHDCILIGTSWGEVLVASVAGMPGGGHANVRPLVTITARLKGGHKAAITCIAADDKHIVSCDDNGSVCQWEAGTGALLIRHDRGAGSPATCVAVHGDLIITGYASGHVRIFRTGAAGPRFMEVEVAAHARPVTALSVHPSAPTFVTVGEDGLVNVWSLPEVGAGPLGMPGTGTGKARLLLDMTHRVPNAMLCGVAFVSPAASAAAATATGAMGRARPSSGPLHIVTAAYDSYHMTVFLGLR